MEEVDLNNWKWLREVPGEDIDTLGYYEDLADKNEALVVGIQGRYSFNVYVPEPEPES